MEDLKYKAPENGRIYGTGYPRPAALAKVTGTCDYGDDIGMKMPDALHLAVVMPGVSHANILSIDTTEAEAMPGVEKVITAKDVKGINRVTFPVGHPRSKADGFERPIIADKKIYRYGDVLAVVAARTRREARAAAKKVKFELEQLPEYMNILDACAEDAMQIFEEHPNVFLETPLSRASTRGIHEGSQTRWKAASIPSASPIWSLSRIHSRPMSTATGF
jgi:aldehyde oxidoreductase